MGIMDLKEKEWSSSSVIKKCCADCKTTKTPLWRGGPAGPKTLCNACGIRYRKRRACTVGMNKGQERKRERAQKTVVVGGDGDGGGGSESESDDLMESLRMKIVALGEEVLLQRSPWEEVVKKQRRNKLGEEEQAAVCLMALSCGFVFA
ncbi:GATA transcription factor 15-like [Lotus japonicus]|uniref:GATA transcription factor 15-like n=1 Tax=Lotus japonicus TaxID=34305 RepID=UPI00258E5FD2|nr:GATA transcription factor 15-like [Lotus japonicus]